MGECVSLSLLPLYDGGAQGATYYYHSATASSFQQAIDAFSIGNVWAGRRLVPYPKNIKGGKVAVNINFQRNTIYILVGQIEKESQFRPTFISTHKLYIESWEKVLFSILFVDVQ